MKSLFITLSLFICSPVLAEELSEEKTQEIIKSIQNFDKDCSEFSKNRTVANVDVVNKTAELLDKVAMQDFVSKHFDIKLKEESSRTLTATLEAKSSTVGKVETTHFKFTLVLTEKVTPKIKSQGKKDAIKISEEPQIKELCNRSYESTIKEQH